MMRILRFYFVYIAVHAVMVVALLFLSVMTGLNILPLCGGASIPSAFSLVRLIALDIKDRKSDERHRLAMDSWFEETKRGQKAAILRLVAWGALIEKEME